ncbi:MAG: hypothetical protein ACKPHU_26510 [Planctomycetaceae bacterium]
MRVGQSGGCAISGGFGRILSAAAGGAATGRDGAATVFQLRKWWGYAGQ